MTAAERGLQVNAIDRLLVLQTLHRIGIGVSGDVAAQLGWPWFKVRRALDLLRAEQLVDITPAGWGCTPDGRTELQLAVAIIAAERQRREA